MNWLQNKSLKKYFLAFIIGSSIFATISTFSYTGVAYRRSGRPKEIPFEILALAIPLMFGVMNILNIFIQSNLKLNFKGKNFVIAAVVGAVTGLTFSFLGRFGLDLPSKIFNISPDKEWTVHIIAPLLYAAIFALIIQPINEYLK